MPILLVIVIDLRGEESITSRSTSTITIWGAQAASLQWPAACRPHLATQVALKEARDKRHLGKLPRWAGWQTALAKTGNLERRGFIRHIGYPPRLSLAFWK
jgi:hypothetical protein